MNYVFRFVSLGAERIHVYQETEVEKSENELMNVISDLSGDCYTDYEAFFRYLRTKVSDMSSIKNISLEGNKLIVDSVEYEGDYFREMNDVVLLDDELISSKRFISELKNIINFYESVKEETIQNISNKCDIALKRANVLEQARVGLANYSRTGEVISVNSLEELEDIYGVLETRKDDVLDYYDISVSSLKEKVLGVTACAGMVAAIVSPFSIAILDNALLGMGVTVATTSLSCYMMHLLGAETKKLKNNLVSDFISSMKATYGDNKVISIDATGKGFGK